MDRAQFSAIVKLSQQSTVQLLVDLAAQVAAVGNAQDGAARAAANSPASCGAALLKIQ
jgi:hypothetical protein